MIINQTPPLSVLVELVELSAHTKLYPGNFK